MTRPLTYRQIAADVGRRIRAGQYPPGTAIPSYRDLARLYGVSTSTAQRSVRVLRDLGLAMGVPGRGVFVKQQQ
jgi:GntR family transcriptional regulator